VTRRGLGVLLVALALGLGLDGPREQVVNRTPLHLRHRAVALYTRLLPPVQGTADLAPMDHLEANPYAINVFLEQEVEEWKLRRSLEMIRDAGFGWIKQQVVWAAVEGPGRGRFVELESGRDSWIKYDRIVNLAEQYGLKVIFRIDTSPEWARPIGVAKLETPPRDADDYAEFARKVAERYEGRVRHFQIWNEPNIPFEWGDREPSPAEYTNLLRAAYRAIKSTNPDAVVISAAMAPTTEYSEKGINELIFLQRMYEAGAKEYFDVLGANAYGLRSGPDDRRLAVDRDVNFSRPQLLRQVMVRNGDAAKPIWASEVGWNSAPPDHPGAPLFGRVDRDLQARYTVRAYERAQEEWPWMGVMALWHFRLVAPEGRLLPQFFFNAVDDDFTPEPLYLAMRDLALSPRPVPRGYRQEDDWRIGYWGAWRRSPDARAVAGGYAESASSDAGLSFRFRGTDLDLVLDRFDGGGQLAVSIDGRPAHLVDGGGPGEVWGARVSLARALPDGVHVVEARVADARPVRVDGFVIDRRTGSPGLAPETALLLGGALAVGAAARTAGRSGRAH
jgi:hypothetical protein